MNTRKIFGYGGIFAVILMLTGCGDVSVELPPGPDTQNPNPQGEPANNPSPAVITYTVAQDGGADETATSTGIKFTFSKSIDDLGLTAGDITVGGKASKDAGALTGSGTNWTLPITVSGAGWATVQITKTGIEAATKNVTVFKEGESAPTSDHITATYTGTAAIYISTPVDSFKTDLTVKAIYSDGEEITLKADEYDLSGDLMDDGTFVNGTKTVSITVTYSDDDNIQTTCEVTVSTITYTVEQDGGVDGVTNSTGIKFTFNTSVDSIVNVREGLQWDDITVGGKATQAPAEGLTGSGTTWTLALLSFMGEAGIATVSIDREGIEAGIKTVIVYKAGEAATVTVTFDSDGGSAVQSQSVINGDYIIKPADPTKAGYLFDGWNEYIWGGTYDEWDFDTKTVQGNITLTAKWLPIYTVTFNANGGSPTPDSQSVVKDGKATSPGEPSLTTALWQGTRPATTSFVEWRKQGESAAFNFDTAITGDTTLNAVWNPSPINLSSTTGDNIVEKAINYINSTSATTFTLVLGEDVPNVGTSTLSKSGVTLTITSVDDTERVISKGTDNGAVFTVSGTAKLVIDGHITLQGKNNNDSAVVNVQTNSSLELKGYAKITGNTNSGNGGGVCLYLNNASFTMDDFAAIKDNTASYGGGVFIDNTTSFTMNGGEISGNTAVNQGGGVHISGGGTFKVLNETVKANIKNNSAPAGPQVNKGTSATFTVNDVAADTF